MIGHDTITTKRVREAVLIRWSFGKTALNIKIMNGSFNKLQQTINGSNKYKESTPPLLWTPALVETTATIRFPRRGSRRVFTMGPTEESIDPPTSILGVGDLLKFEESIL